MNGFLKWMTNVYFSVFKKKKKKYKTIIIDLNKRVKRDKR